ncbi:hypothetical protein BC827DRAFT_1196053 [Russula dissimulans]|nr:hypothetical protein BC827DRAFT_1196053 [Russula dissimulans]
MVSPVVKRRMEECSVLYTGAGPMCTCHVARQLKPQIGGLGREMVNGIQIQRGHGSNWSNIERSPNPMLR